MMVFRHMPLSIEDSVCGIFGLFLKETQSLKGFDNTYEFSEEMEKYTIYGYSHGGISFNLAPTCEWDSYFAGYILVPKNISVSVCLDVLNRWANQDHYYIFDDDEKGYEFEGSMEECIDYAKQNQQKYTFEY